MTSYTPFVTTDTALLNQCLTNGTVVQVEGQFFITPEASTVMRNANLAAANNTNQQNTTTKVEDQSSKKIHYPSCRSVPKIAPQNYATSNQTVNELIAQGYTTCGICFK